MSHEMADSNRRLVYTMPAMPSDVLRSREFNEFFRSYRGTAFSVQTKDGWCWLSSSLHTPVFTVIFSSRERLDRVISDSTEDSLESAYLDGDLDVRGDIFALFSVAEYVLLHSKGLSRGIVQTLRGMGFGWLKGLKKGSKHRDKDWRAHLCPSDLPVSFFQRWLGPSLGHTCARFRSSAENLETAQEHALESICRMLKLDQEDRFLDMSCGWGSLLLYATARHRVQAQGIAFGEQQAAAVSERIQRSKLQRECAAGCRDLASTPFRPGTFDKIADLGLFHPVEHTYVREYLECSYQMLTPGGLLLLHRVTRSPKPARKAPISPNAEVSFADELPLLSSELGMAESAGLQVLSVEDLSRDHQQTVHHWIEQLQCTAQSSPATMDRESRMWLFHLLDTATKLEAGNMQLHQILLCRPPEQETIAPLYQNLAM